MKFLECLPNWVANCINGKSVREIRLRNNAVVRVNIAGSWWYCSSDSLTASMSKGKILDMPCDDIVRIACNNSIYAYEQMLANGYFTLADGTRFGVAGKYTSSGVFQEYTSICIRVPHCVSCATAQVMSALYDGSTLIVGLPGVGKTTLLRDIAKQLSAKFNVVVVDERGELDVENVLSNCDVLKWTSKLAGFEMAIRCLSPDYIICDELGFDDQSWLAKALSAGVKVVATLHGNLDNLHLQSRFCEHFDSAIICRCIGSYQVCKIADLIQKVDI